MLWISFLFSSFLALCTAFSYAELSSLFPKSVAEYIYGKNATRKISIVMLLQFDIATVSYSFIIMSILFLTGTLFAKHKKIRKKY